MKFTRLKIVGFKSFVEPTDFVIEPGLTGIVGPNGCGKSNLTEALRWVMGETSTRNMRAGGMDDVIFAGTNLRPARNTAEVTLFLDNATRTAPAAFNDSDALEVSRRIERDGGSTYRVNGREVRARDVQLLFADASTGARSPALVRQGQISEIISAKPTARRRLLEEAAGISGLHARRHETELRLKAAESNLERLDDVLTQIAAQLDGLKRQAKSAIRYRQLSAEIKETEALLFYRRYLESKSAVEEAERALNLETREVAARTEAQAAASKEQALAAYELPGLRDVEAKAAAVLQRLASAREALDAEERRAVERTADLDRRIVQLGDDIARERGIDAETDAVLERLQGEEATLTAENDRAADAELAARDHLVATERALNESEDALAAATAVLAEANARRNQLDRAVRDATERLGRIEKELAAVDEETAALQASAGLDGDVEALRAAVAEAKSVYDTAEAAMLAAEHRHVEARTAETAMRSPAAESERAAHKLETEAATLANLIARGVQGRWRPILDEIRVAKGYETALGAALGDDLDATTDPDAPMRWAEVLPTEGDPSLPEGTESIIAVVEAPDVLARRLAQIGLVDRAAGPLIARRLAPGQRLVSKEGDLWRWDGFVAAAEAPTAAARRLAEQNRLAEVEADAATARARAIDDRTHLDAAHAQTLAAAEAEQAARSAARAAQATLAVAQDRLANAERRASELKARISALAEAGQRLTANRQESEAARDEARAMLDGMEDVAALDADAAALRARVAEDRAALAEARGEHQSLAREAELRARRLASIESERGQWSERKRKAEEHVTTLEARLGEVKIERESLDGVPGLIREKRLALLNELDRAEAARAAAADRLAEGETRLAGADRSAREALAAVSEARETRARAEARLEAARERRTEIERTAAEALETPADRIPDMLGLAAEPQLPPATALESKLDVARRDRERLGPVNLRADEEASEVAVQHEGLLAEKEDLEEAIRRLRTGIGNLNREARERLLAAFGQVNTHFQKLFQTLFGGGTAELVLTESDDPLEAGLDMIAKPPGKKPQSLGLLSGGEQALTATALIFAVFLTNPAPICVLDEVDAPLDDHNVERYCDLLAEMVRITQTRFVTITHNPITMARMHRLFGVTMAERGVSQLVSVDLENAERLVEAA